jgi:hypothetical protein
MAGLITLPWCIKPLFGFLFDTITRRLKSQKSVILLCILLRLACNYLLAFTKPDIYMFYALLAVLSLSELFENITCECILVL